MKVKTVAIATGFLLLAAITTVRAVPEDVRFGGGSYDGWGRDTMTESAVLGGVVALVSLSSGANQTFDFTATPSLAALTIEAEEPAGTMTNGGTIRVTVPAGWACRFDTGASVSFSGDAAGKVGAATYTDGGRTLSIPVTSTFVANDTLIVSGLRLEDLRLVSPDTKWLELDFDGDGTRDVYDLYTLQVRALWPGGAYDGWGRYAMAESAGLGGALVSLSSGTSQTFDFTATPLLAALTIEAADPLGTITNGGTIRLTVPADWPCRFDTGASVSFSGDAAGKVGAATYTDGGRTLSIPVTSTFVANDTLIVSGLRLEDLRLVSPDTKWLELDFDGDGTRDVYDLYDLQVRALWPGGAYDGWGRCAMTGSARLAVFGTLFKFR